MEKLAISVKHYYDEFKRIFDVFKVVRINLRAERIFSQPSANFPDTLILFTMKMKLSRLVIIFRETTLTSAPLTFRRGQLSL
jgi:hypothetical protein